MEMFGKKNWGINYTISVTGPALGGFLYSTLLAGSVYQAHITDGGNQCYGVACYQITMLIAAASNLISGIFLGIVVWRTFSFYKLRWETYTPLEASSEESSEDQPVVFNEKSPLLKNA